MFHRHLLGVLTCAALCVCGGQGRRESAAAAAEGHRMASEADTTRRFIDHFDDINPTARQVTERRLTVLADWVGEFRRAHQRLPARLEEIVAPDPADTNFLPHDRWWTDGWQRRFRYTLSGSAFELRSAGEDGLFGTADDLVAR
jgi:hypothetical protein